MRGHPLVPYAGPAWRIIEDQARRSTVGIVDTRSEHDSLEDILEASKSAVPDACRHLGYHLNTPFRYGRYYKRSTRFRRRGSKTGVWYGSEAVETALAEFGWYKFVILAASTGTPLPKREFPVTAISARIETRSCVDLTSPELSGRGNWTDPDDYTECLDLADTARGAGAEVIRYGSVRHPDALANLAVLACAAFDSHDITDESRWVLKLTPARMIAFTSDRGLEFLKGDTGLAHPA